VVDARVVFDRGDDRRFRRLSAVPDRDAAFERLSRSSRIVTLLPCRRNEHFAGDPTGSAKRGRQGAAEC
jgi:hypothetical protein